MLIKKQFDLLIQILKEPEQAQRYYGTLLGISLGSTNATLQELRDASLVVGTSLTENGRAVLLPHKVDNAVIMAAGLSSRMAPFAFETPKGLISVKGEVLIERQIKQLRDVGITDITVVVGYMKEKFFYLEEKYRVKILVNENYYKFGTASTIMVAEKELKNTYICYADNYYTENIFEAYAYQSFYAGKYFSNKVTNLEFAASFNKQNRINDVTIGTENFWGLCGQTYFTRDFSEKFLNYLRVEYENPNTRAGHWETVYLKHIKSLDLYIKKYPPNILYEFDSLVDLKEFDPYYIDNVDSNFIRHIISVFNCSKREITQIEPIKENENALFSFDVLGKKYVYQHLDKTSSKNFKFTKQAVAQARNLGLYDSFVFFDEHEGWSIRQYLDDVKKLDAHNKEDISIALATLRKAHSANISFPKKLDLWDKITECVAQLEKSGKAKFIGFEDMLTSVSALYTRIQQDKVPHCFCHCASFASNFVNSKTGIELLNWDNAAIADPAFDLGTFICHTEYTKEEALQVLQLYYGRDVSPSELRHHLAYVALAAYFWFVHDLYLDSLGDHVGESLYRHYSYVKEYLEESRILHGEDCR